MVADQTNLLFLIGFSECNCLPQAGGTVELALSIQPWPAKRENPEVNFTKTKTCQDIECGTQHKASVQWLKHEAHMKLASEIQT